MRKPGLRLNKKGFSLIELLVAVCILAVAAIPMLRSFISSFYANAKARERLTAMMVAEDMMESMKGHKYEELASQFNAYRPGDSSSFTLFANDMVQDDTRMQVTPIGEGDGIRVEFQNLHAKSAADHKYDATLSLNAAMFREPNTLSYNSYPLVDIKTMSNVYDAYYFTESYSNDIEEVIKTIKSIYPDQYGETNSADLMAELSRLIVAVAEKKGTVTDDKGNTFDRIQAYVTVKYFLEDFSNNPVFEKKYPVYDNVDTASNGGTLRNFYVFYYPGYDLKPASFSIGSDETKCTLGGGGVRHDDTVVFFNKDDIPLAFYAVKQIGDRTGNLNASELGYNPYVVIIQKGSGDMVTDVCSNLNVNLADESTLSGINVSNNFNISRAGNPPADFNPFKGLAGESRDRLYRAYVEIFKEKSYPAFNREDRLAELDSTKID